MCSCFNKILNNYFYIKNLSYYAEMSQKLILELENSLKTFYNYFLRKNVQ